MVLCVGIYTFSLLTGLDDLAAVCLNPYALVERFQLYRCSADIIMRVSDCTQLSHAVLQVLPLLVADKSWNTRCCSREVLVAEIKIQSLSAGCVCRLFTSPFVHVGILHVAFNMLAFVPIASSLERQLGTLQTLHLLLLLIIVGDLFYLSASYLAALV